MCAAARFRAGPTLTADQVARGLLPRPRTVRALPGIFSLGDGATIRPATALAPSERSAAATFAPKRASGTSPELVLSAGSAATQGYRLGVTPQRVEVHGESPAGLFYGLQTLRQIQFLCGDVWPALEIDDAPDFAVRGLSYDVSRGRVPTLTALKELVDRLAGLKVNQLQLYTEHTFAFAFDPEISAQASPLTPDEMRDLDVYCAERRMELVPSLASCGHMGRILSLPRYRQLAEVSPTQSWEEMTWRQRVRGLTLDVTNRDSRALLAAMYAEVLPLFSSPWMNVSCDETFDLGQGRGQARARELGPGGLLLEHLRWLHELCGRHGKRIMFWGDMLKKHPDLVGQLPRDAVALNWGYDADADYESTALFCDSGLTTYVCPGTSSWNRFVADINTADANIRRYAAAGKRYGVAGLLNTDWGDDGHVAPPAGAWHPIALGAALAWNAEGPPPTTSAPMRRRTQPPAQPQSWRNAANSAGSTTAWPRR